MNNKFRVSILLGLIGNTYSGISWALSDQERESRVQGYQIMFENDLLGKGKTDRWYTNGVRASWNYAPDEGPTVMDSTLTNLRQMSDSPDQSRVITLSIGQSMYTPANIARSEPQPYDRPWGGWLYFGAAVSHYPDKDRRQYQTTELKIGVIGPASLAEEAQRLVHDITNGQEPMGWDNQLKPMLGVQLNHLRGYRVPILPDILRRYVDTQATIGGALGNVRTYGTVSGAIVIGQLETGTAPLAPSNEGDFIVQDFSNRSVYKKPYGFMSVSGNAVAYNHFLQGAAFGGRSEIEVKRWVTAFTYGISVPLDFLCKGARVIYSRSSRTAEFTSPRVDPNRSTQTWGTLTLSVDLNP